MTPLRLLGSYLPIVGGIFRAEDEDSLEFGWAIGCDAAFCAIFRLIKDLDFACFDVDLFDAVAIEGGSVSVASDIVDDPFAIGGPDGGVR